MKTLFKNNKVFYLLFLCFLISGTIAIVRTDQFQLHIWFNGFVGSKPLDTFFKYITYLGDGLFLVILALVLFFFNFKNGLFLLTSYALSGGFTQFMKEVFFDDVNRPFFYRSYHGLKINIVEDVHMYIHNSFPSGHSTSAFCLFFCLSYMVKPVWAKLALFIVGILTAFSRVYLSQHFFEDIFAGSIIGVTFSSFVAWVFFISAFSFKMNKLEKPVYKLFQKGNG